MTTHSIPAPQTSSIPADLELDSINGATHLGRLQSELAATLQGLRLFGTAKIAPVAGNADWQGLWDDISRTLVRIVTEVGTMTGFVEGSETGGNVRALEAWNMIQVEDARLVRALKGARSHVGQLGLDDRKEWNVLARALESQLVEIHACAQSLRLKLEELKERTDRAPVARGPLSPHDNDLRKAVLQLEREKHEFAGFTDVFKGLWMWSETSDERMRENRSLVVVEG